MAQTQNDPIYTSDGKCSVFCEGIEIARSYAGPDGYEVRILQGMPREATIKKICEDCPDFAWANGIDETYYPKLFVQSRKKKEKIWT